MNFKCNEDFPNKYALCWKKQKSYLSWSLLQNVSAQSKTQFSPKEIFKIARKKIVKTPLRQRFHKMSLEKLFSKIKLINSSKKRRQFGFLKLVDLFLQHFQCFKLVSSPWSEWLLAVICDSREMKGKIASFKYNFL